MTLLSHYNILFINFYINIIQQNVNILWGFFCLYIRYMHIGLLKVTFNVVY